MTADTSRSGRSLPLVALVAHEIHDHGGMERAGAELIRRLHHDVRFVVVARELAPDLRPLVERWVRVRVPRRPMPLKFVSFYLWGGLAVRRLRADLVQTTGALVPNRADIAAVHFCHAGYRSLESSFPSADVPLFRRLNTALVRRLAIAAERRSYRLGRVKTVAAVSSGVAAEVGRFYPGLEIVVAPNGVDHERFKRDAAARDTLRSELHVADNDFVLLFVGGDWDRKGLATAIEAVQVLSTDGIGVRLWVVGEGDTGRFSRLANEAGVASAVSFFGARLDTQRFYQAADVFVLPSAYETFSLVAFEAASSGLPLVISNIHTAPELVGQGEAGLVIDPTPGAVAGAIATLLDPTQRTSMGRRAEIRSAPYTWERATRTMHDLYSALLAGGD